MDRDLYTEEELSNAELVNRDTLERLKAKKKHRKLFRTISYILLSIVMCLIFIVICMAVFLKIENIEVKGNDRYTPDEIIESSGITTGQNLYAINKNEAKENIYLEYPYISEVVIRRELPSTLHFKVYEEQPKYYTEICGEYFLLSDSLRVLEKTEEIPLSEDEERKLIPLYLSEIRAAIVGEKLEFEKELVYEYISTFITAVSFHETANDLTSIDMRERYNIYVEYQNRFSIYMGDYTETDMKLTFAKLMIESFPPEQSGSVDAHDITVGSVILDN